MLKIISLTLAMAAISLGTGSNPILTTPSLPMIHSALAVVTEDVEWLDSDGDNCPDTQETGLVASRGGLRDPADPYDFFDVTHDGAINALDLQTVAFRWGSTAGTPYYYAGHDRSIQGITGPFDLGPPDGVINIYDLQAMAAQFGAVCQKSTPLSDIAPMCDGNLKEAGSSAGSVLAPGKTYKECQLVRDAAGKLIDVLILEETTAITDEAYSSDPVGPAGQNGLPKAPPPAAAGSTAGPAIWQYGCFTAHNRRWSYFGYTTYDLALKECFAAVIDPTSVYYGVTLENGKDYWNTATHPWTLTSGEFDPAWTEPARWNTFGYDFQRERWGDATHHVGTASTFTRTVHAGVRVFWANDRDQYDSDLPDGPGVLGYIWY